MQGKLQQTILVPTYPAVLTLKFAYHYTSYADVCIHQLLAAAINVAPLPSHLSAKSYLHDLCSNMNQCHRAAQMAGHASVQLYTLIFFAHDGAKEEFAYIMLDVDTTETNVPVFNVIVHQFGIEGCIRLPISTSDLKLKHLPKEHKLIYNSSPVSTIQVADK